MAVSLMGNVVLLGVTAGYVPESDIPHIGYGIELYLTVPEEAIEEIHRKHQRFRPTDIVKQPWGDNAFKVKIGRFRFMIASQSDGMTPPAVREEGVMEVQ